MESRISTARVRPLPTAAPDEATLVRIYRAMVTTRLCDERLASLQKDGAMGFFAQSIGEEAAVVASAMALREQDWIFPTGRELGALVVRGVSLDAMAHHALGTRADSAKGRAMPFHMPVRDLRIASPCPLVGTHIVHAAGCAWAAKLAKDDVVTLAYFGDGATSSADFHNGCNFAGVFRLPVVLFCRNNGRALSTPFERQTASATVAAKAVAYGIRGVRCDGADAAAVYTATREAALRAARGDGATLVEAVIPGTGDPARRLRMELEARGAWDAARESVLIDESTGRWDAAVRAAESTPPPDIDSMFDDVYEALPWHLSEQSVTCRKNP